MQKQLESGKQPENVEIDTQLRVISLFILMNHLIRRHHAEQQADRPKYMGSGIVNFFKWNRGL